ncbi:transmembrane protein 267 [Manduca sexta]|uniref:Transmembrane protein 267 n=1 Tax=Manduca sexta TaxID=7130 RepID=A0A921ZTB9_MANSE|nr:transmembrane protein 267 [Manduca sexta]KAG6463782.1 hypothetical protein O3G_MSEX014067 [Manduca sexta]
MKTSAAFLTSLLITTAIFGDYVVFNSKYSNSQVFRAFSDTFVHGILGGLSSVVFFNYDNSLNFHSYITYIIFCTVVSSLIDIDHVIAAWSLQWKDITNAKQRGIFHATTFWLIVVLILTLYGYVIKKQSLYTLSAILLVSALSHHLRDANRRGIWMPPLGSTPPLNKLIYITLLGICPHILAYVYQHTKFRFYKHVYQDFVV